jgi:HAD superfamily hydrolase (TIGR01509 family)
MTSPFDRRALLLDLDGTLAESLPLMRAAYAHFLNGFGAEPTAAEFARLNGPPLTEVVCLLKEAHHLPGPAEELLARYSDLIDRAYLEVEPALGARVLLERARALGYIVGVVTSNSARRTRDWLDRAGLGRLVDVLIAGEHVTRGKPDPEAYLLAATRAGCSGVGSIAVEDSPQGARAARGAGLRTFVLDPDPASSAAWPEGVERIPSLVDLVKLL